ncbi:MAG: hypothetical protein MUC56_09840 [Thermoanaerobaculales bacterium]|jgi:hypothetical protein|nr:hypothetical protein [Thermoanaerobaculales bacterium]
MRTTTIGRFPTVSILALGLLVAGAAAAPAANFVIVNGDGAGEGLNDPTPVAPVGGNTGTTLGAQRLILLQAVADVWAARISSPVDIRILANFNPMGNCSVLGSTGPGNPFMNFPGAPLPNILFHSCIADSITGIDQNPGGADFYITYNSDIDGATCPAASFYYGLDGAEAAGQTDLFPVVLHEMGHGLGSASFVNPSNGTLFFGAPGIFDYFVYDMSLGLGWSAMTNGQRAASAVNTGNLVWSGPNATTAAESTLHGGQMEIEVTAPPAIVGTYAALGAGFGGGPPDELAGEFELVDDGSATPTHGCEPLIGFTPGRIAVIDRGTCEFGLKALNAQGAGATAAVIANDRDGTVLVLMGGGEYGAQVGIPAVALGQNDGATIKAELPGVTGVLRVLERLGQHAGGNPLLYAPSPVEPGSSVSHWDTTASPDLLMEPFLSATLFDEVDLTPAQFRDVGHTVIGLDEIFADSFESGNTSGWSSTTP